MNPTPKLLTLFVFILLILLSQFIIPASGGREELHLKWSGTFPGEVMDISTDGSYLFLACNESGLQITSLNSSDIIGEYDTSGLTYGVAVQGNYVYLADWNQGLDIFDIREPDRPVPVGHIDTPGYAYKIKVSGDYAYVCDWAHGLAIIDVSNRSDPKEVGRFTNVDYATDCTVVGNLVYLVDWWGLRILNVADPAHPRELSNLSTPGYAYGIDVQGDYAYIADDYKGLRIVSISDPLDPHEVGHFIPDADTIYGQVSGKYVYLAIHEGGVLVIDVSDPSEPDEVAYYDTPGESRRVLLYGNMVYAADGEGGVWAFSEYKASSGPDDPNYYLLLLIVPFAALLIPLRKKKPSTVSESESQYPVPTKPAQPATSLQVVTVPSENLLGKYMATRGLALVLDPANVRTLRETIENDLVITTLPERRFRLYLVMRQLSYLLHPGNEWLKDLFHNHRETLKFNSYFDIPGSPARLLARWGLPSGLQGRVHLDGERKAIVERITNSPPLKNFVIIGEPGVGKTALLFEVFDTLMRRGNASLLTSGSPGKFHEYELMRLFIDDVPEYPGVIRSIMENGTAGVVVSARETDWESLPYNFQRMFTRLTVRNFSGHELMKLAQNLLEVTSVTAEEGALDLLIDYADGSPIFVWTLLVQLRRTGQRHLTASFIKENASRGMLNYIGDILARLLMEGEGYRRGGFHGLAMLYFLAAHIEGRRCSTVYFNRVCSLVSERIEEVFGVNKGMDPNNPGLVLSCLSIQNDMIRFPHDFWADLVLGKGERNPFSGDIVYIREKLSDTGYFEKAKREALPETWKQVLERYRRSPGTGRDGFLAFCENILSNFTIKELKSLGVDIEVIREIAALYSHLPEGERILTRIERVSPLPTQKIIEIKDSVVLRSSIG